LSPSDLDAVTIDSYADTEGSGFGSADHNLGGIWPWEEAIFRQWVVGHHQKVLVAGAGGGREMIALARMGFSVSGFDASAELVEACRTNLAKAGVTGDIVHASPGAVPEGPPTHEALVIGRGVYHHIPGQARRITFLYDCRRRVKGGSPIAIGDCHMRAAPSRLARLAIHPAIEQGDSVGDAFNHYFTDREIIFELEQAGFVQPQVHTTSFPGMNQLAHATAWAPPTTTSVLSDGSLEKSP